MKLGRLSAVGAAVGVSGLLLANAFTPASAAAPSVTLNLKPSNAQIAACLPHAHATVKVALTTDTVGFDTFSINGSGLRPNKDYTVFLINQAGPPFGAAEYIGDFHTDGDGDGGNTFK